MNCFPSEVPMVERLRREAGHLLVHRVIERDDWIAAAVLDIAAGDRKHWNPKDWDTLLKDLRCTPGRLAEWLDLNT